MTYTKDNLKTLFRSRFDLCKWQKFLVDYFKAKEILHNPEQLEERASEYEGYYLGETNSSDNYRIGFFYYRMTDGSVAHRKVGLRNLVRPYLNFGIDVALAVFEDGENWRLSLVCNLKGEDEATIAKRFTYVFGDPRATYATPVKRFFDLQKCADMYQAIREAFSVEALSDDFFTEYRKQYAKFVRFITGKEYVKSGNKWVEKDVCEPDAQFEDSFGGNKKLVRDYIKKMMGRIVFLYFLQSKGWLAGNYHYMHDLFHTATDDVRANYLDFVLEPMFFGLLNTKPEDRATAPLVNGVGVKYVADADRIPYLNGGLFQQEDVDRVNSKFPAEMFKSLFDFFDSYNFTIDENDPDDAEVGVDPEMLGKIFENLLEDNKDKGAFYTPKEIVRYMCQESLVSYLQTGEDEEAVRESIVRFVHTYDVDSIGGAVSELAARIDQRLKDVKICDPAIGSGAFPMGLLRELYNCRKAIEIFDADNAADIKRHIIQNNIYGVDLEHGAVDIARLRFWLALVIDEKKPMPLPNLDFKIMQGNSLLESFHGVDLSQMHKSVRVEKSSKKTRGMLALSFEETDVLDTIQRLVKSYFDITDHAQRNECRQQINKYIKDYMRKCADGNDKALDAIKELEFPNSQFFLWHTYFADVFEGGGFDIVIGNPPYISAPAQMDKPDLAEQRARIVEEGYYTTLYQKWDLYVPFMEKGLRLLADGGSFSMIVPFPLSNQAYGRKFREWVMRNYNISEIVDLNGTKIFDNATVSNLILFAQNTPATDVVSISNIDEQRIISHSFEQNYDNLVQDRSRYVWNFTNDNRNTTRHSDLHVLGDFCYISVGMVLNADEKKARGEFSKDDLISEIKDELHPREYIEAKDIERYRINNTQYLEYNTERCPDKLRRPTFRELYNCDKLVINRLGTLKVALDNNVHFLQSDSSIMAILWKDLSSVDNKSIKASVKRYSRHSRAAMEEYSRTVSLEYLLAVLNSKYAHTLLALQRGDDYHIYPEHMRNIPIAIASEKVQKHIGCIVKDIVESKGKNEDTSALENEIDIILYHLYGLTYDEVLVVDPTTSISSEEYLAYNEEG